jgi:hypothetical protein
MLRIWDNFIPDCGSGSPEESLFDSAYRSFIMHLLNLQLLLFMNYSIDLYTVYQMEINNS